MPDSYPLVVRRLAALDINTAALWYEDRIPGLGVKFVADIDACLETIQGNPELSPRPSRYPGLGAELSVRGILRVP